MFSEFFFLKILFIFSSLMFLLVSSHFLLSLLFLEIMSMSMYFMLFFVFGMGSGNFLLLFLCVMVLEGVFGLGLVISNSRKMGGDFFNVM